MPRLFISYRVADTTTFVDHLYDRLRQEFGETNVFRDNDALGPGEKWTETLESEVRKCDLLLAVIGPTWLEAHDEAHRRRLDQPDDWVRKEILLALELKIPIIPVLAGGTQMPPRGHLPDPL
jgi:TIR domain-containing protein